MEHSSLYCLYRKHQESSIWFTRFGMQAGCSMQAGCVGWVFFHHWILSFLTESQGQEYVCSWGLGPFILGVSLEYLILQSNIFFWKKWVWNLIGITSKRVEKHLIWELASNIAELLSFTVLTFQLCIVPCNSILTDKTYSKYKQLILWGNANH